MYLIMLTPGVWMFWNGFSEPGSSAASRVNVPPLAKSVELSPELPLSDEHAALTSKAHATTAARATFAGLMLLLVAYGRLRTVEANRPSGIAAGSHPVLRLSRGYGQRCSSRDVDPGFGERQHLPGGAVNATPLRLMRLVPIAPHPVRDASVIPIRAGTGHARAQPAAELRLRASTTTRPSRSEIQSRKAAGSRMISSLCTPHSVRIRSRKGSSRNAGLRCAIATIRSTKSSCIKLASSRVNSGMLLADETR